MFSDRIRDAISAEVVRLLGDERKRHGLSMNQLAAKAGLSQSLISSIESNPWNPTLDSLLRIASVLEINLGDVIRQAVESVLNDRANSQESGTTKTRGRTAKASSQTHKTE